MRVICRNIVWRSALLLSLTVSGGTGVWAENAEDDAVIEKLKLRTDLLVAQAELRTARFSTLGIPQYENKATLGAKGGEIEAAMLASWAVREAAGTIAGVPAVKSGFPVIQGASATPAKCFPTYIPGQNKRGVVLVMSTNDGVDFSLPRTVGLQLQVIEGAYESAFAAAGQIEATKPELALAGVSTAIMALKTAAGLFGQETIVTGIELASIDDAMLVNAVAGKLPGCAIIVSKAMGTPDFDKSEVYKRLQNVIRERDRGQQLVSRYPDKPSDPQKAVIALFKEADALLATFHKVATTASDKGIVPLSLAIVLEKVDLSNSVILRVSVNAKGGSLVNSKNIATTFGVDPVKVSGGLVASYSVTQPDEGVVKEAGVVTCQTSLVSLRKIQTRRWNAIDGSVSLGAAVAQKPAICNL